MFDLGYVDSLIRGGVPKEPFSSIFLNWELPKFSHNVYRACLYHLFHVDYPAAHTVCADGGANRLRDVLAAYGDESAPSVILGDLDSVDPDVLSRFRALGTEVMQITGQDDNDFAKSLTYLAQTLDPASVRRNVVVLGAIGGRLDHTIANINSAEIGPIDTGLVHMFSKDEVAVVLPRGVSTVTLPDAAHTVGLLPLFGETVMSTSGLEWDVHGAAMRVGGMISSSNAARERVVRVESRDRPVCMTASLVE